MKVANRPGEKTQPVVVIVTSAILILSVLLVIWAPSDDQNENVRSEISDTAMADLLDGKDKAVRETRGLERDKEAVADARVFVEELRKKYYSFKGEGIEFVSFDVKADALPKLVLGYDSISAGFSKYSDHPLIEKYRDAIERPASSPLARSAIDHKILYSGGEVHFTFTGFEKTGDEGFDSEVVGSINFFLKFGPVKAAANLIEEYLVDPSRGGTWDYSGEPELFKVASGHHLVYRSKSASGSEGKIIRKYDQFGILKEIETFEAEGSRNFGEIIRPVFFEMDGKLLISGIVEFKKMRKGSGEILRKIKFHYDKVEGHIFPSEIEHSQNYYLSRGSRNETSDPYFVLEFSNFRFDGK